MLAETYHRHDIQRYNNLKLSNIKTQSIIFDIHSCVVFMWPFNGHINTTHKCISSAAFGYRTLRKVDTPSHFSTMFTKGNNLSDFLFVSHEDKAKTLKRKKELASWAVSSFFLELTPT